MRKERIMRSDGRYVLLYTFTGQPGAARQADATQAAQEEQVPVLAVQSAARSGDQTGASQAN